VAGLLKELSGRPPDQKFVVMGRRASPRDHPELQIHRRVPAHILGGPMVVLTAWPCQLLAQMSDHLV
jgi:hypothetical protein